MAVASGVALAGACEAPPLGSSLALGSVLAEGSRLGSAGVEAGGGFWGGGGARGGGGFWCRSRAPCGSRRPGRFRRRQRDDEDGVAAGGIGPDDHGLVANRRLRDRLGSDGEVDLT